MVTGTGTEMGTGMFTGEKGEEKEMGKAGGGGEITTSGVWANSGREV
jgi:hypothetical protein